MGDFIKELNVIDFLGMLLPGAFLLLLLSGDLNAWGLLGAYWGEADGPSTAIRITLLLVGGYVAGSLLHEAGDLLERMLWRHRAFDPRTYAACFTGLWNAREDGAEQPAAQKAGSWLNILWGALPGFTVFYGLLGPKPIAAGLGGWMLPALFAAGSLLCGLIVSMLLGAGFFTDKELSLARLDEIRRSDARYLAYPAQENYVIRKRMLFDGFRAMCRNLFLALVILRIFAQCSDGKLAEALAAIQGNRLYEAGLFAAQVTLLARYWRFSYLKYKYAYEDSLNSEKSDKKLGAAKPAQSGGE